MKVWYRHGDEKTWTLLDEGTDLRKFGERYLNRFAGHDNDNGYSEYVEFYHEDGTRTYAYAHFPSAYYDVSVPMEEYIYGDREKIVKWYGEYAVEAYKYAPDRDWLIL